jgi:hypothetical protein
MTESHLVVDKRGSVAGGGGDLMRFRQLIRLIQESQVVKAYSRYLMTRLSLQVVYLWRHVSSTAPPFILWWWNLKILLGPLHRSSPFIGELRCQAIQMEHGLTVYSRENPKRSLYCNMSVGQGFITKIIQSWYQYVRLFYSVSRRLKMYLENMISQVFNT